MELRHLRYFVAVAEERHITRAAARLGIQQPPLSLQIQQLEAELGAPLLLRTPRGVELTQAGAAFFEDAKAILLSVERAAARTAQIVRGHVGRLAIGFTTSAILHPFVPGLIRDFQASYPEVQLDLREDNAAGLIRAAKAGAVAAALLRIPVERPPALAFLELAHEPLMLVLPAFHRLAAASTAVRLAELAGERFVLVRLPGAPGIYANVLAACRAEGFEPAIAAEVPHMLTNVSLVAAGVGISVVPASTSEIGLRGVRYRRLIAKPALTAPLTLAHRAGNADPILANLIAAAWAMATPPSPG